MRALKPFLLGLCFSLTLGTAEAGVKQYSASASGAEQTANKDVAGGYAGLDGSTLLKTSEFPAFSGDCTTTSGGVVLVCTKAGGVVFAASATTDTTNAANISSGILPIARLPSTNTNNVLLTASSGTWTPAAGVTQVMYIRIAPGGAGGCTAGTTAASAQGGLSGDIDMGYLPVTPGTPISYTIGAVGASCGSGSNPGGNGGDVTFGALPTLKGGLGGSGSSTGQGAGATQTAIQALRTVTAPSGGTVAFPITGLNNVSIAAAAGIGGTGGNAPRWGLGGAGAIAPASAGACTGYGSGGGGASNLTSGAASVGTVGCPGAIYLTWN